MLTSQLHFFSTLFFFICGIIKKRIPIYFLSLTKLWCTYFSHISLDFPFNLENTFRDFFWKWNLAASTRGSEPTLDPPRVSHKNTFIFFFCIFAGNSVPSAPSVLAPFPLPIGCAVRESTCTTWRASRVIPASVNYPLERNLRCRITGSFAKRITWNWWMEETTQTMVYNSTHYLFARWSPGGWGGSHETDNPSAL